MDRLLVVDPILPNQLLGVVRHADIEDAYRRAVESSRPVTTAEPDSHTHSPASEQEEAAS
jgi:hypothetical protein